MQDEVSRQIAGRLRLKLSEAKRRGLPGAILPTRNLQVLCEGDVSFGNVNAFPDSRPEADLAVDLFQKSD